MFVSIFYFLKNISIDLYNCKKKMPYVYRNNPCSPIMAHVPFHSYLWFIVTTNTQTDTKSC